MVKSYTNKGGEYNGNNERFSAFNYRNRTRSYLYEIGGKISLTDFKKA